MRAWSRGVIVAVAVLALAGCTGGGDEPGADEAVEVRIGVLAPLTGSAADAGQDAVRGAQLAAQLINDGDLAVRGGATVVPAGVRLAVVPGDTRNDPDQSIDQADRLVAQEGVAGLIGLGSPEAIAVASQRTERLSVPFIGADATADFLTERGLAWFFRTGPTERTLAATLFSVLRQQAAEDSAARRVAIVHPADREAGDLASLLADLAVEGGFTVAGQVPVDLDADPAAGTQPVDALSPGAVFLAATAGGDARRLVERFGRMSGPLAILGFGAGFSDPASGAVAEDSAAGLLYTSAWSRALAERSPAAQPVLRAYAEQHREPMPEAAASAFTAVLGFAEAVGRAGSAEPTEVRTALLGLDIPGPATIMPWDGIRFDETGQNVQAVGVVQQRVGDGVRVVFPLGVATGRAVSLGAARR